MISLILSAAMLFGCDGDNDDSKSTPAPTEQDGSSYPATNDDTTSDVLSEIYDFTFSKRDTSVEYDSATAIIELADDATVVTGSGVAVDDNTVTISAEGVFYFSGALSNGRIVVRASKEDKIQLVFDGVSITSLDGAPIEIWVADKVFITLVNNTVSTLRDAVEYADKSSEVDSCIYSKEDLTINGSGELIVHGTYKHGVVSKDDLVIAVCKLSVYAVKDGLRGKDSVKIKGADISVVAGSDGMISDNAEDVGRGYIYFESGKLTVTADNDGLQAQNIVYVCGGTMVVSTGGGAASASNANSASASSAKGLKADAAINIDGGDVTIDSRDDAIHSSGDVTINGGAINIATGDDGIHADDALVINDGTIAITESYEGLEATNISVMGGTIELVSSDDGMNAAGGGEAVEQGGAGHRPNEFAADSDAFIKICGGYIWLDVMGDGIDSNGDFYMNGGTLLVSGPVSDANGAIDYQGQGVVNGGVVVAIGSSGMAQSFDTDASEQDSLSLRFNGTMPVGTIVTMCDSQGNPILSFTASKQFESIVMSCPELISGSVYEFFLGGTVGGADSHGFAYGAALTFSDGESAGTVTA